MPDAVLFSAFATGLAFLARHRRTAATADLVLAGLALGVAFGTKWYGVSSVIVVLTVWAATRLLAGVGWRDVGRQSAVLVGLVAAAGGVWLLRNLALSANPVFPLDVAPLGVTVFPGPPDPLRELVGFTIAGYFDQPDVWADYLYDQYRAAAALPAIVFAAGALAAVGVLLLRARLRLPRGEHAVALTALALIGLLTAVYSLTPYSALGPQDRPTFAGANVRYLVPAMIVAAALGAWASGRLGRAGPLVLSAVGLVAVLDGLRVSDVSSDATVSGSALAAAVALLGAWLLRPSLERAGAWMRDRDRRWVVAVSALVLTALLVPLGHQLPATVQRSPLRRLRRHPRLDPLQRSRRPADRPGRTLDRSGPGADLPRLRTPASQRGRIQRSLR